MANVKRALEFYFNYFVRRLTPTIVFSMERSGSIALFHSLVTHGEFALSTHHLDPAKIAAGRLSGSALWAHKHLILKGKPVKIITLVRNPLQSMVSHYARLDFTLSGPGDARAETNPKPLSPEEISRRFETEFLEKDRYRHHLDWFEREFKVALGMDVYQYPFNHAEGFVQIEQGPFKVLILRTELDDAEKARRVSDFLGLSGFEMLQKTLSRGMAPGTPGDQAPYAQKYKNLKRHLRISNQYLDTILESKHATHFFPPDALAEMRQQFTQ